jgi:hypothetical protein
LETWFRHLTLKLPRVNRSIIDYKWKASQWSEFLKTTTTLHMLITKREGFESNNWFSGKKSIVIVQRRKVSHLSWLKLTHGNSLDYLPRSKTDSWQYVWDRTSIASLQQLHQLHCEAEHDTHNSVRPLFQ